MVKTLPSSRGGMDSIPGWGTQDPHAVEWDQKLFCFVLFFFQSQLLVRHIKA